uniref:Microtubule associated tumor suppressor 1a n=1 Tax=Scleropages formosus TaxID=113540 RepID=A0A8C9VNC2_SCLFO
MTATVSPLQREDAQKRRAELSQELLSLRGELVSAVTAYEKLQQEKEELRVVFEGILQKLQEQHQRDLADLEERLRAFYQAEWEKVHEAFQEQADKYRTDMQQQVNDLRSKHEVSMRELEASHLEKVENVKQQYEASFEGYTFFQWPLMIFWEVLFLFILLYSLLQKDAHALYLEQELESLKVVLDIKNKQLHQQDQKLVQMDKLMERNMQLDERLQKVQQENEDLKERMDKHAALSRQLSTEQAVLQQSLQKESKVNKRLSMENEELLWKLYNGDLSSPRKLSPSSVSPSLQSPRSSGIFSSAPVSPR